MNGREYLEQVHKCDIRINNKLVERDQWMTLATKTTVSTDGDRVQTSSSGKLEDAVMKIIKVEEEIDEMIDYFIDLKRSVIRTLESLQDPVMYDVLHKRYIQYMYLSDIAESLKPYHSVRWVQREMRQGYQIISEIVAS